MAKKTKVTLDSAGIVELLQSEGVASYLRERGAAVAAAARAGAPRRSGGYADSIQVYVVQRRDRTVVQVGSDVDYALGVEARTGNLARALDSA